MKRYDFAPLIVPPDARRFLDLPENQPYLPSFYKFYKDYCLNSPENPIKREVDGNMLDFSQVVARKITRSKDGRSAIVLRSTQGEHNENHHRLFVRPFTGAAVTEYVISETAFSLGEGHFSSNPQQFTLYLATAYDGQQGVLELSGNSGHSSTWTIDGHEYNLEDIPYLSEPKETQQDNATILHLPGTVTPIAQAEFPEAM